MAIELTEYGRTERTFISFWNAENSSTGQASLSLDIAYRQASAGELCPRVRRDKANECSYQDEGTGRSPGDR
jgi:hypothetical protein